MNKICCDSIKMYWMHSVLNVLECARYRKMDNERIWKRDLQYKNRMMGALRLETQTEL